MIWINVGRAIRLQFIDELTTSEYAAGRKVQSSLWQGSFCKLATLCGNVMISGGIRNWHRIRWEHFIPTDSSRATTTAGHFATDDVVLSTSGRNLTDQYFYRAAYPDRLVTSPGSHGLVLRAKKGLPPVPEAFIRLGPASRRQLFGYTFIPRPSRGIFIAH